MKKILKLNNYILKREKIFLIEHMDFMDLMEELSHNLCLTLTMILDPEMMIGSLQIGKIILGDLIIKK
jgi:hypothetical protein